MSDQQNGPTESLDFFGPPALLRGESEALYAALLAEVDRMIEPKTILDRIDVRDITDKIWESQRYKRLEPRLIESACVSALAHLLAPLFELDHARGLAAATMYYSPTRMPETSYGCRAYDLISSSAFHHSPDSVHAADVRLPPNA